MISCFKNSQNSSHYLIPIAKQSPSPLQTFSLPLQLHRQSLPRCCLCCLWKDLTFSVVVASDIYHRRQISGVRSWFATTVAEDLVAEEEAEIGNRNGWRACRHRRNVFSVTGVHHRETCMRETEGKDRRVLEKGQVGKKIQEMENYASICRRLKNMLQILLIYSKYTIWCIFPKI